MTCTEGVGGSVLSHASAAPRLDLSLVLLQPAGKRAAAKVPDPHQFSRETSRADKSFLADPWKQNRARSEEARRGWRLDVAGVRFTSSR